MRAAQRSFELRCEALSNPLRLPNEYLHMVCKRLACFEKALKEHGEESEEKPMKGKKIASADDFRADRGGLTQDEALAHMK